MVLGFLDFLESEKAENPWYVWVFSLFYLLLKSVVFFYFLICSTALKTVRSKATGVRIPHPKIEELALQAQGVGIFTFGEYPCSKRLLIIVVKYDIIILQHKIL